MKRPPLLWRGTLLLAVVLLTGCSRYAEFTLPVLDHGDPSASYSFAAQPEAVLRAEAGWESHDVLNPSVVEGKLNLYSGFDGKTWRTGLAVGSGSTWQKRGMVLEPDPGTWEGSYIAANGTAIRSGGQLLYWYVAGPRDRPRLGLWRFG